MTLKDTRCKVKVEEKLREDFQLQRGVKQGDVLSTLLFNIYLEKLVRQLPINAGGTIMNRSLQYIPYADDILLRTRNK